MYIIKDGWNWLTCFLLLVTACSGCLEAQQPTGSRVNHKYTNGLVHSTSPYLLQHAHNPVNWMPWGPEAFAKAKAENKPIFVSIGYSTCYWCHVMERESFENEQVAKVLNDNYVTIKVDREERPDIDEQLMLATQLMTGRGGWPNSVWLTTDGRPWMAGTYFPRERFISALTQLSNVWKNDAPNVQKQANSITDAVRNASRVVAPSSALGLNPMQRAMNELGQSFDATNGGFGTKPKFPPHGLLRLLAFQAQTGDKQARHMMTTTLDAMWCGGVHDHVGGGFHRYSTDERWFLPHFEKMLYDNAQLMRAFSEAYVVTKHERYRSAVEDIFVWLKREMTHDQGGFFSAIDSESEGGEEGRFYTWSVDELGQVLNASDSQFFLQTYNFQPVGNFTEEATGHRPGTNIPYLKLAQIEQVSNARLVAIRDQLQRSRAKREYPHLDDKVLTSWNGLMISALARAGQVFGEPKYIESGAKAARFLSSELQQDGQLLRTWRNGKASLPGYLNDYAFLAEAMVELHAATGDKTWATEAARLTDEMLRLFEDTDNGGFYFTSPEHEALLLRSKNLNGGGNLPVGNGVAVQVLLRLHTLTGEDRYWASAEHALQGFGGLMRTAPRQVEHLVLANSIYQVLKEQQSQPATSGIVSADAEFKGAVVNAGLFVSHLDVAPGDTLQVAVRFEIADGFHLYGPSEGDVVRETTIRLQGADSLSSSSVKKPKGKTTFDRVFEQDITIYEGEVWFTVPVTVGKQTNHGDLDLVVSVNYQACDDKKCLAPKSITLTKEIRISDTTGPRRFSRP